ncbi:MAG: DUF11 domain-containing protein, partial [Acidobacteriota bacterium]
GTNIVVTDNLQLPFVSLTQSGATAFTCNPPPVGSNGTFTCTAATMPAGAVTTITLVGHVPVSATRIYSNSVSVTSDADPNPENDASSTTLVVESSDLSVTKSAPAAGTAGTPIDYSITIASAGPDPAAAAVLSDTLPAGTTFVSLTPSTGPSFSCSTPTPGNSGTVNCVFPTLASGASAIFTLRVQLGGGLTTGTIVTNTATASSATADPTPGNDSQSASTTVTATADVSVVKTGPATATAGSTIPYSITVMNSGPSDAANTTITDVVPAGTTFVSITQSTGPLFSCSNVAGTVTCSIPSLVNGASATFTLTVNNGAGTGTVTNTATVASTTSDSNGPNNSSSTSANATTSADLAVTKSGPANAGPASVVHYIVTVRNNGPSTASTVTLSDTVPSGSTFTSLSQTAGPTFSCTTPAVGGTGAVVCTIGSLPNGSVATFDIGVSTTATGGVTLTNIATASSATSDPVPPNNSATATTIVAAGSADLTIVKTASSPSVVKNTQFTYTLAISNAGPTAAGGVSVADVLPAGVTFVSSTPSQGSCSGTTTVVCTLGTLAASGTASIALVVQAGSTSGSAISNTATVSSGTADPNPANNSSTTGVTVVDSIPTLSPLGMALLALALGAAGALFIRLR